MFYQNDLENHVVDKGKLSTIIEQTLKTFEEPERTFLMYFLQDTVSKVKLSMCEVTKEGISSLPNLCDNITPLKLKLIKKVLDESLKIPNIIDFDDMLWIPVKKQFKYTKYDWVFIDEVQDISKTQFELIKLICDNHTRVIGVGDSKQSMYGFRCADSESMKNFKDFFKAQDYPLSICYRCPQRVVKLAKRIVPQIEHWEEAEQGIIKELTFNGMLNKVEEGDMLICRTNAPLVNVVHRLIRMGKEAKIKGTDMQKRLFNTIKYLNAPTIETLLDKTTKKIIYFQSQIEDGMDYHEKKLLESKIDLHETLRYFLHNSSTFPQLIDNINNMYSDNGNAISCSTIHKAKGLEADRVFIYRYDLMPHPMASNEREFQEEKNIEYVAITRAKKELYFINNPEFENNS